MSYISHFILFGHAHLMTVSYLKIIIIMVSYGFPKSLSSWRMLSVREINQFGIKLCLLALNSYTGTILSCQG